MKKKSVINSTPKKGTSTAYYAGPLTPKKKVGVKQGKVGRVIYGSPSEGPSDALQQLTLQHFRPGTCFLAPGRLFLTRVKGPLFWKPFSAKWAHELAPYSTVPHEQKPHLYMPVDRRLFILLYCRTGKVS